MALERRPSAARKSLESTPRLAMVGIAARRHRTAALVEATVTDLPRADASFDAPRSRRPAPRRRTNRLF